MADEDVVLADLELTRSLTVQMIAIGSLGFVVAFGVFAALFQTVVGSPPTFQFTPGVAWWTSALDLLVLAVLGTVLILPHELLHGLAMRYYGGDPRYGVGVAHFILPYAYATTDHEFTRNQFIVVLLTPLVVMSGVGVPLMVGLGWGWLVVPLATNAAGAVGDVWMTMTLLGYPTHIRLEDHESGVRIVGTESDRPRPLSVTAVAWDALAGTAVVAFATLLAFAVAGPFVLSAMGVDSVTIGTPDTVTYLFSFSNTPTEISMTVGPAVLGVGAVVGLVYALLRSYLRVART